MFNLRNLDLNLLTVFEAVYELGSASRAADRLALSQSATSHALARLREACGEELFVRGREGLSPTPVARTLYPPIKQALEALRSASRRPLVSIPHNRNATSASAFRIRGGHSTIRPASCRGNRRSGNRAAVRYRYVAGRA